MNAKEAGAATSGPGLEFVGAAGTVTGSKTLVRSGIGEVLVDCGMYQGSKALREANWARFPVPASSLEAIALTHAHIDHTGLLPRFVAEGFRGPVFATAATAELLEILLPDSASLQEEDAHFANKKGFSKHAPALPLFTLQDAEAALKLIRPVARGNSVPVAPGVEVRFRMAGHILGSAWLDLTVGTSNGPVRLAFSGDIGRGGSQTMPPIEPLGEPDILVVESTYGDRSHPPDQARELIRDLVREIVAKRSVLLMPAFAVDRTEDLLFILKELDDSGEIPSLPIWVDSPMANRAYVAYVRHPEELGGEAQALARRGENPFMPGNLRFARTPEESKALNDLKGPAIIISASGMATGGRVLHHLKNRLPNPGTTVLFCGYQANGTRGRSLVEGAQFVKIHGEMVPVRAKVAQIDMLSSHADREDILAWLSTAEKPPRMTYLIHGEPESRVALAQAVSQELRWPVATPESRTEVSFSSLGLG